MQTLSNIQHTGSGIRQQSIRMQVFVQNEADSNQKNLHNEKTLEYQKTVIVKKMLTELVSHVFDHVEGKFVEAGRFFGRKAAISLIEKCRDQPGLSA
jgi:flagellar basal body rod protein FlgC